ncbi:hypothetical protein BaRGS_00013412 [Batillaria attramentaria]|uniref:G-protein coupled receptors family 1 profile domain-containing protein n=1 Tax=Batillaria attramentaria TaxID=370345 RepID=A0ABD0L7B7_9CAEN
MSYVRDRHLHTVSNLYLVKMAGCDFTVGLVIAFNFVYKYRQDRWPFGRAACKMNNTTHYQEHNLPVPCVILAIIVLTPMSIMALLGNAMIIASFMTAELRVTNNLYVIHLAFCDLLIGAVATPFHLYVNRHNYEWELGRESCEVVMVSGDALMTQTVFLMLFLAYGELYILTQSPDHFRRKRAWMAHLKIFLAWAFSISLQVVPVVFWKKHREQSAVTEACHFQFLNENPAAAVGKWMILCIIPFLALLHVAIRIYQEMTKRLSMGAPVQAKRRVGFIAAPKVPTLEERSSPRETFMLKPMISPKTRRTSLDPKSRSEVKAGKKVLWPLIVFLICWTPYSLAVLVNAVCASCIKCNHVPFSPVAVPAQVGHQPLVALC